jgi:hypothetical protein
MEPYVHDAVLDMHMARDELIRALDAVGPDDWQRQIPYGSRTLRELLGHLAGADQAWAVAAQGLLKGEAAQRDVTPADVAAARERAIERSRSMSIDELRAELDRRRALLLGLYELLEPAHLALGLPGYGERHNSVRERIWRGYHDRLHANDVRRALGMTWHPPTLTYLPELDPVVAMLNPTPMLYVIYSADPVMWERPCADNPGWTYRQLLAHVATGDWVLQRHLEHVVELGEAADWPDVPAGNEQRLAERRHSTERALVDEYLSMRHGTLLLLAKLEPKHLSPAITFRWEEPPQQPHTFLEYLVAFERHERIHAEQLRPAMKYLRAWKKG